MYVQGYTDELQETYDLDCECITEWCPNFDSQQPQNHNVHTGEEPVFKKSASIRQVVSFVG